MGIQALSYQVISVQTHLIGLLPANDIIIQERRLDKKVNCLVRYVVGV